MRYINPSGKSWKNIFVKIFDPFNGGSKNFHLKSFLIVVCVIKTTVFAYEVKQRSSINEIKICVTELFKMEIN